MKMDKQTLARKAHDRFMAAPHSNLDKAAQRYIKTMIRIGQRSK